MRRTLVALDFAGQLRPGPVAELLGWRHQVTFALLRDRKELGVPVSNELAQGSSAPSPPVGTATAD